MIVAYELKVGTDHDSFFDTLKELGDQGWAHYLRNLWFLATNKSAQEIYDILKPHIGKGDYVFVAPIVKPYQGWLPKKAWDWIRRKEALP